MTKTKGAIYAAAGCVFLSAIGSVVISPFLFYLYFGLAIVCSIFAIVATWKAFQK